MIEPGDIEFAFRALEYFLRAGQLEWPEYKALCRALRYKQATVNGCRGKRAFLAFTHAQRVARRLPGPKDRKAREPYRCPVCGFFHLRGIVPEVRRTARRIRRMKLERADA